jgi:hypothetical protein
VLAAAVALAGGCGGSSLEQDAERAASIAAEGALLAHGVAEGSSTKTFTRVHAGELRKNAEQLAARRRLAPLSDEISRQLQRLERAPGDARAAAEVERALERATKRAEGVAR